LFRRIHNDENSNNKDNNDNGENEDDYINNNDSKAVMTTTEEKEMKVKKLMGCKFFRQPKYSSLIFFKVLVTIEVTNQFRSEKKKKFVNKSSHFFTMSYCSYSI
jgi:hypothetical protein